MRTLFWFSLAGIAYTYVGYPLSIWVLSRVFAHPWKSATITPSVSIVLAVHNGASLLQKKIDHLLRLDYPEIREIIIVSDGSTDTTADLLAGVRHPAIRPVVIEEHVGKAAALNAGVAKASADVVVFVDIRPEIGKGAIRQLVSNFFDPEVGCAAGELCLREEGHDPTTSAVGGLYWRYEQWIRTCESAFDSPVGVYGGFYAVRRSLIAKQPDGIILDDMFQPLSVIRQGYRSILDSGAKVFDTWPKNAPGEFQRKVRTLAGNFQLFKLAPWLLSPTNRVCFQLASHKAMRLIVPYLLILLLVSSAVLSFHSRMYSIVALAQFLLWAAALMGLRSTVPLLNRLAAPMGALLVLNAAAVVGLYRFIATRGPLQKIWNTGQLAPMR